MRRSYSAVLMAGMAAMAMIPGGCAAARAPATAQATAPSDAMKELLDYARSQHTTGFVVVRGGKTLVDENWAGPSNDKQFSLFVYGHADDGSLFEDVASQQKSFVAVLVGIAIDKGLIDVDKPVSDYIGAGWSHASPEQEAKIRVLDVLTMSTGLDEKLNYEVPPGTHFFYNTAAYAISKKIVSAAANRPLADITRDWLTVPLGMKDTAWRQRPAVFASVGNPTGLVTTPADSVKFGEMVLHGGVTADGHRIISKASLDAMFVPSATNPSYGRLWWLNGGAYTLLPADKRHDGPLIPAAPDDLAAALGFLDRRIYVVPSLDMVVVRTGAAAPDKDFDQQLWLRLMRVVG